MGVSVRNGGDERGGVMLLALPFRLHKLFVDYPYFSNFGMLRAAAACREAGVDVKVFDALAQPHSRLMEIGAEHYWAGCRAEAVAAAVRMAKPSVAVVCGHPFMGVHLRTEWLARMLGAVAASSPGCEIVYADCFTAGMHFIDVPPDVILRNYPEVRRVVKYHAEAKLPELLNSIMTDKAAAPEVLSGSSRDIVWGEGSWPDWGAVDVGAYDAFVKEFIRASRRPPLFPAEGLTLPAMVSAGCRYACSFCTSNAGGGGYTRMPGGVIRAMADEYKNMWGASRAAFMDGLANPDAAALDELIEIMHAAGLKYEFLNGLRADTLERVQIEAMKGRVSSLSVSAESGSDCTLSGIGKRQPAEAVERVAAWCAELGVPLHVHYVAGFPGEPMRDVMDTFTHAAMIEDKYGATASVQYATPLPGTRLYADCVRAGMAEAFAYEDYLKCFSLGGLVPGCPEGLACALDNHRASGAGVEKVIINLTYACDNDCVFCAVGDREKKHSAFEDVVEALYRYRKRGAALADFDGGEPAMYPKLFDAIRAAAGAGYSRITVTTNGRRLSDAAFAEELLRSGLTDLLISLHGADAETHEAVTRAPGSFEQTVDGIKNAVRLAGPGVSLCVNTTLGSANFEKLPETAAFVASLGVKALNVQMLTPFGSAAAEHAPEPSEAAAHIIRAIEENAGRLDVRVINMPRCFMDVHWRAAAADTGKRGRDMVFVGHEGVNLAEYLKARRVKDEACAECPHLIVCDGKYMFG